MVKIEEGEKKMGRRGERMRRFCLSFFFFFFFVNLSHTSNRTVDFESPHLVRIEVVRNGATPLTLDVTSYTFSSLSLF
jgi:hypothetical protein